MLIAIFALLLISVVGIALVVSSGTNSSLAGNYRTATSAYYAGMAGLEEARGRLLWKNPDYINITNSYPNLMSTSGIPAWGLTQVLYITNPAAGETVNPTSANPANYPDTEYAVEFPWGLGGAAVEQVPSVSNVAGLPGPSYKWVRINPVTEQALKIDVNGDGTLEGASVLFYDPAHLNPSNQPEPGLVVPSVPSTPPTAPTLTSVEALEITALAVAPNGGHRLLQYVVAPLIISPDAGDQNYPAALTLDDGQFANSVTFTPPNGYQITGVDGCNPPPPPGLPNSVAAIGYSSSANQSYLVAQVTPNQVDYPGAPIANPPPPPYKQFTPSLWNVGPGAAPTPPFTGPPLRQTWLTPSALDAAMQDVINSADVIVPGPATAAQLWSAAPAMSAANPMTIVVKGDLNLSGGFGAPQTGFGLLLVTGTLYYQPTAAWDGVVLVVGAGKVVLTGNHGTGGIVGAMLIAQTRSGDGSGALLPSLQASFGPASGPIGNGISYNSCWVNTAKGPLSYKVLSFREVPLPN
jgi:hypothetical protein